jgi:recombination protein RecA
LALITRKGAQYYYKDQYLGNGRRAAEQFLEQNPQLCEKIEQVIRRKILPDRFGNEIAT